MAMGRTMLPHHKEVIIVFNSIEWAPRWCGGIAGVLSQARPGKTGLCLIEIYLLQPHGMGWKCCLSSSIPLFLKV